MNTFCKRKYMSKFKFPKQFHAKHEVLGSILGGCMLWCILYKCNLQTYTSWWIHKHVYHCFKWCKKHLSTNYIYIYFFLSFFLFSFQVNLSQHAKKIHDSTMWGKKNKTNEEKNYMMTWCVIPHYINLGPRISLP